MTNWKDRVIHRAKASGKGVRGHLRVGSGVRQRLQNFSCVLLELQLNQKYYTYIYHVIPANCGRVDNTMTYFFRALTAIV